MAHYNQFDKIIIAISEDGPVVMLPAVRKKVFESVFQHLPKVEVVLYKGVLTEREDISDFPIFDVCLTGNPDVIKTMEKFNKPCEYVFRLENLLFRGTAIRGDKK